MRSDRGLSSGFRHLDPVPAPNVTFREADGTVSRVALREHCTHSGTDALDRTVARCAGLLLRDGTEHANFVAEIDGEPIDIPRPTSGICRDEPGRPRPWRVRRVAEPVAREAGLDAEATAYPPREVIEVDVAGADRHGRIGLRHMSCSCRSRASCIAPIMTSPREIIGRSSSGASWIAHGVKAVLVWLASDATLARPAMNKRHHQASHYGPPEQRMEGQLQAAPNHPAIVNRATTDPLA